MRAADTLQVLSKRIELYERAATYSGRPRERMVALCEADELSFRLYEQHYRDLQLVRVASQLFQPRRPREDGLHGCEHRVVGLLSSVIADAIRAGDLSLRPPLHSGELAFTVWSLVFGIRALGRTAAAVSSLKVADSHTVLQTGVDLLFDAIDWQPVTTEWDYERTRRRVRSELFSKEWAAAFGTRGGRLRPVGDGAE